MNQKDKDAITKLNAETILRIAVIYAEEALPGLKGTELGENLILEMTAKLSDFRKGLAELGEKMLKLVGVDGVPRPEQQKAREVFREHVHTHMLEYIKTYPQRN